MGLYQGLLILIFDEGGQYAPHSAAGLGLLEHELTHVVEQQISGPQCSCLQRRRKKCSWLQRRRKRRRKSRIRSRRRRREKPLDLDDPKIRGIVFEGMYVDKAKSYYESNGYKGLQKCGI